MNLNTEQAPRESWGQPESVNTESEFLDCQNNNTDSNISFNKGQKR